MWQAMDMEDVKVLLSLPPGTEIAPPSAQLLSVVEMYAASLAKRLPLCSKSQGAST